MDNTKVRRMRRRYEDRIQAKKKQSRIEVQTIHLKEVVRLTNADRLFRTIHGIKPSKTFFKT